MPSKTQIAIKLSRLKTFENPKNYSEQYTTDSEIAATVLWHAFMKGDIQDNTLADLGAGTGILAIGAADLGAKKVFCVEQDEDAITTLKENLDKDEKKIIKIINGDIKDFNEKVDVVIMNPPFGTKEKHADRKFLEKATEISQTIYSFHKTSTLDFIHAFAKDKGFAIDEIIHFKFPLRNTFAHHKKKREYIDVSCIILRKI